MIRLVRSAFSSSGATTRRQARFRSTVEYTLLATPALIFFFMFRYLPMGGIVMAFKNFRYTQGIFGSPWVGFRNFEFLFASQDFQILMRNTIGYSIVFLVTTVVFSVCAALLLFELTNRTAVKFYQTVMFLPRFLSWVVVGFITWLLLNPLSGVLNQLLQAFGMERVNWYTTRPPWPFILVSANLWKTIGTSMLFYYAALMAIDSDLFEAANIDGASRIRKMWSISVPSITPVIVILTLLDFRDLIKGDFGLFWQIPRQVSYLRPVTDIIETYVFRGILGGNFNIPAAVGLFQSVVAFGLIVSANWFVRRVAPDKALF